MATKRGYDLAMRLNPYIGTTSAIAETCSKIARATATLDRLNEEDANGHPANENPRIPIETVNKLQDRWEARIAEQSDRTERRIVALVGTLPQPDEGPWSVEIQGDPRGPSVVIIAPDGYRIAVV